MARTFLTGADLLLPGRVVSGQTVVIEGDRIVDVAAGPREFGGQDIRVDLAGHVIAPGFIDVHVHGVAGVDVLDGAGAVARVAAILPRWGVTAFCPTSIACAPAPLEAFLAEINALRADPPGACARVLPAHLESNFINPAYRGAQPQECLCSPAATRTAAPAAGSFTTGDILNVLERHRPDVGIVTMAPELDGGLALLRALVGAGLRVSLGHSGATFDVAQEAIAAGARHATHLFNRMSPMSHRDPGLAGAVLASDEIAAELISDGHHVHPAVMRVAIAAKRPDRMMAITDGTAGSGLPRGSRARLGGHPITVEDVARLDDGTMAGSVGTMDRMFVSLATAVGLDLPDAAAMCSTTPARELGLHGHGVIAAGALADLTVLDRRFAVWQTWVGGRLVFQRSGGVA